MHQTTIRFGSELWEKLELAAEDGGISVAQYVREAAIERLARRGSLGDFGGLPANRVASAAKHSESALEMPRALEAESEHQRLHAQKLRATAEVSRDATRGGADHGDVALMSARGHS